MPEIPGFQSFTPTTTLVLALVPLLYFIVRPAFLHLLTPKPLPGIPYRKGRQYPIIGDGLDAGKWLREQATITQWFDGCIQAFMYGGDERGSQWGVLDGKRTAKEMISDFAASDLKRNSGYEGICQMMFGFGHGARQVAVTDVDDTMWKNLAMFHPRAVTAANNLIKLWHIKADKLEEGQFFESSDDLMDAISKLIARAFATILADGSVALNLLADIAFGKGYNLLKEYIDSLSRSTSSPTTPPSNAPFKEVQFPYNPNAMYHATEGLLNTLPLFSAFPKVSIFIQSFQPTFRHDKALVHKFIYEQIRAARERAVVRGDERAELADCAIDQALLKDGTVDALSELELRDEVLLFLVAGQETIARTLSWGMKMLSRAPDVQKRLKKELTEAGLLEREITYNDLLTEKVPYLEATTQEILRLAGTAAGVSRIATRDTTVLGKHIPKGTTLYFPLALMAHLPLQDLAGDSRAGRTSEGKWKGDTLRKFVPERWLDGEGQFDGQVLELKTMLAKINLAFFLESIPSEFDSDEFVEYISRKPKVSYRRMPNISQAGLGIVDLSKRD
ncbi:hypothetical protein QFC19_001497 [Naganishia cerealis]|uniref:Uncharacterized protein n=1 Tax=Naganishia cerealis TaxID=610337 RepID=A0ACC2WGS3_9TREE|nr:hypothetical protein QFC19_001497 [Naganishia cerealis]